MSINLDSQQRYGKAAKAIRPNRLKPIMARHLPVVVANTQINGNLIDSDARTRMIAEAAYYLAAQRDFAPGHELDDWLAAEHALSQRIGKQTNSS